jgi:prolipoprotein diacylglyceryltransferase
MRIGFWWFDLYTLRILGATVMATAWLYRQATRRATADAQHLGWWLLLVAACALFLGRAGYIAEHRDYFLQNPRSIAQLRGTPGLQGFGALVGGILGAAIWAGVTHRRLWDLMSLLTPAGLWIAAGAWWGCWDAGCAAGKVVTPGQPAFSWLAMEAPDLYRDIAPRYPVQLMHMAWAALAAGLGWTLGEKAGVALSLYLAGTAGLTWLRGDPAAQVGALRLDTVVRGTTALLLAGYGLVEITRRHSVTPSQACKS